MRLLLLQVDQEYHDELSGHEKERRNNPLQLLRRGQVLPHPDAARPRPLHRLQPVLAPVLHIPATEKPARLRGAARERGGLQHRICLVHYGHYWAVYYLVLVDDERVLHQGSVQSKRVVRV